MADGTIDAAIVHGTADRAGVTSHRLADDPLLILVAGASGAQLSGLESLADRPLLLHVSARGSALTEVLVRESRRAGRDPRIDYFTHHAGPFAALAEQDRGWSALYARQASVFDLTTLGVAVVETEAAIGVPTTLLTRPEDDRLASLLLAALDGPSNQASPPYKRTSLADRGDRTGGFHCRTVAASQGVPGQGVTQTALLGGRRPSKVSAIKVISLLVTPFDAATWRHCCVASNMSDSARSASERLRPNDGAATLNPSSSSSRA